MKKNVKYFLTVLLAVVSLFAVCALQSAAADATYNDGNGNTYQYSVTDGEVTISGFSTANTAVDLVIPAEIDGLPVTKIGYRAFRAQQSLKSVIFPDTVQYIDANAFSSCDNLESINLPNGLKEIGSFAFAYCHNLTSDLYFSQSVEIIEKYAFADDCGITFIIFDENSKCKIGQCAFSYTFIENITLPEGTECGPAFGNCIKLKTANIKGKPYIFETVYLIDGKRKVEVNKPTCMFEGCEALETVTFSDSFELYEAMFSDCSSLKSVTFGKEPSPTVIEEYTFQNCKSLEKANININFGKVNQVDKYAFYNCENMDFDMQNDFPALKTVKGHAFNGCKKLHNLSLENITSVGDFAFAYCDSLKSIEIPSGHNMSRCTFLNCTGIETIKLSGQIDNMGTFSKIFKGCTGIKTIILDDNFKMHKGKFIMYFLSSVLDVYSLPSFEEFKVGSNEMNLFAVDGVLYRSYIDEKSGKELVEIVCYPNAKKGELYSTAEVLSGRDCFVCFGKEAFRGTQYLKKIEITEDYYSFGQEQYDFTFAEESIRAFYYSSVEEIVFLKKGLDWIDESMFEGSNITAIDLSGVTAVGQRGFRNCKNLQNIDLSNCEYIYEFAFEGCEGLTNLKLINVWEIGNEAFKNCTGLKFVNFGINACSVGNGAFSECPNVSFFCDEDSKAYAYAVENNIPVLSVNISFFNKNSAYEYTGGEIRPALIISINGMVLRENKDYTVEYFDNIAYVPDGYSYLIVHFIGDFEGLPDAYRQFYIVQRNINSATIEYVKDNIYDGDEIKPAVVVKIDGRTLTEGVDYTIQYTSSADTGTMLFTVTGKGNYKGAVDCYFNIIRRDIAETQVQKMQDCVYTGEENCPLPVIQWNGFTLVLGEDYELRYFDNVDAGFATVVIYGKGNFCGTQRVTFRIFGKGVENAVVSEIPDQTYNGSTLRPEFTVTLDGKILTEGTDYKAEYVNNTEKGTATVIISGIGNYSGVVTQNFNIVKNSVYGFTVFSETQMTATYNGTPLTPEMEVYFGTERLTEGVDYTVTLKNNTNAGTATVTVRGMGRFEGERSYDFTILPCEITEDDIRVGGSTEFNGEAVEPQITVTKNGVTLENGLDYELEYRNNNGVGTAYVTVRGLGNYCDTVNMEYEIYATDPDNGDEPSETPENPDNPETPENPSDSDGSGDSGNLDNTNNQTPQTPANSTTEAGNKSNTAVVEIPKTGCETNTAEPVLLLTAIVSMFAAFIALTETRRKAKNRK